MKIAQENLGYTDQQMADMLGITVRTYQSYKYGEIRGNPDIWDQLVIILGADYLALRKNVTREQLDNNI